MTNSTERDSPAMRNRLILTIGAVAMMFSTAGASDAIGGQSENVDTDEAQEVQDRPAVPARSPKPPAAHVIKFPADRSLGEIKVRAWGTRNRSVHLSPAQGEVRIPWGQEVYLVVDEEAARDLSPLAGLGSVDLQLLSLKGKHVNDSSLAAIQHQTSLRELYLDFAAIRGEGLAHIRHMSSLELISTIGTPLEDAALRHLAYLTALRHLGLHNTRITGTGLRFLKDLPALSSLSITGVSFKPENLVLLQQFKTLRVLSLDTIDISDSDLPHLEALTSLKRLALNDTKLTPAGIDRLKQALPNCSIDYLNGLRRSRITPTPLARTTKVPLS